MKAKPPTSAACWRSGPSPTPTLNSFSLPIPSTRRQSKSWFNGCGEIFARPANPLAFWPAERFETLQNALASDPFTTILPRFHSVDVAANDVEQLKAIAGRNLVGGDERIAQARAAFAALTVLAKKPATLLQYDLLTLEPAIIRALHNPSLTADAAALLGLFGTPTSQTALIDFASQTTRALSDRQAAASAFAAAVKSRGLLLTQQQIAAQYARYNASEKLDQPTQELLGIILDAIEAPAIARGELTRVESP